MPLIQRLFILLLALILCCSCCAGAEEKPAMPQPTEGVLPRDESFGEGLGTLDLPILTEDSFDADDIPEDYLTEAEHRGRVEKIYYFESHGLSSSGLDYTPGGAPAGAAADASRNDAGEAANAAAGEKETVKSVMVYFPAGYDESDQCYNVLYLLHGSNGSPKGYLDPDKPTRLQNLLDHLIEDGLLEPMIVVAATYYPSDGSARDLPLARQVEITAWFARELVQDIIPQVEEQIRTCAASSSPEDIEASRDHRGIAGFSMGGVAVWYVFLQQMRAFKWFLPISEASWDDGEGGTAGIFDSDVSARTLYDAVLDQGYGWNDFRLFVAVGTDDEAFEICTNQMKSLLAYDEDMFFLGENTFCSMMINGKHTASALYTYLYHILPCLFADTAACSWKRPCEGSGNMQA